MSPSGRWPAASLAVGLLACSADSRFSTYDLVIGSLTDSSHTDIRSFSSSLTNSTVQVYRVISTADKGSKCYEICMINARADTLTETSDCNCGCIH